MMELKEKTQGMFTNAEYMLRQEKTESNARSYPRKFPFSLVKAKGVWLEDVDLHINFLCLIRSHEKQEVLCKILFRCVRRYKRGMVRTDGMYYATRRTSTAAAGQPSSLKSKCASAVTSGSCTGFLSSSVS